MLTVVKFTYLKQEKKPTKLNNSWSDPKYLGTVMLACLAVNIPTYKAKAVSVSKKHTHPHCKTLSTGSHTTPQGWTALTVQISYREQLLSNKPTQRQKTRFA